jgi:PTH1 family peptidyl-tRNA hydrolase
LKSIIAAVGTEEFMRLRIGIQPEHPISDSKRFVLDTFSKGEQAVMKETLERAAAAVRTLIRDGALKAMADFN